MTDDPYRQIFDAAGIGLSETTWDGRIIRANDALARLYGYERGADFVAAVGHDLRNVYTDIETRNRTIAELRAGKPVATQIARVRRRDGSLFWCRSVVRRMTQPDGTDSLVAVVADVSDLFDALAMLDEQDGFRSMFENAREGIYRCTPQGRILRSNRAMARLNGYDTVEEMLAAESEVSGPDWYVDPGRWDEFVATIERDGEIVAFESEVHRKGTGETFWISENVRAVRDPSGRTLYYEGTVIDITGRVQAEAHLRAAQREAEQASRAKSLFLANISHELRTPLNAIMGFSEIIRDRIFGDGAIARYAAYAADVHSSASHLLQIINDILDITKAEAGHIALDEDVVDLGELVERAVRLMGPDAVEGAMTLSTEIAPDLPLVLGDAKRLRQVVLNMLSNAVKFTSRGGAVTAIARRQADGVAIIVADTGVGIDPADLERIFEPFYQTERGRGRNVEGTGLGLPISRRLIELHDGRMWAESEPGTGTRIIALLPASRIVERNAVAPA